MNIRLTKTDWLSALFCLGAVIPGLSVYNKLPDLIASNYSITGQVTHYMSKPVAVFFIPLSVAALQLLLCFLSGLLLQPEKKDKLNRYICFYLPLSVYFGEIAMLLFELKVLQNTATIIGIFAAMMLIIGGNFFPKIRRNLFLGIRTPHTLTDPVLWDQTQRFAGMLMTFTGVAILPFAINARMMTVLIGVLLSQLLPVLYSEVLFHSMQKRHNT